jgi:hypothetical protein
MEEIDYVAELERIRSVYISVSPLQRLRVIRQRLANPDHGPNTLVTHVSAVEALARSLVLHNAGSDPSAQYSKFRNHDSDKLVALFLERIRAGSPAEVLGHDVWQKFRYAISYRNLLVHECTYLGQDKYPKLEDACQLVLSKLIELAGLPVGA